MHENIISCKTLSQDGSICIYVALGKSKYQYPEFGILQFGNSPEYYCS